MNVPEIAKAKQKFEELKNANLIEEWELPYENILSRLTASIFFVTPSQNISLEQIETEFSRYENFSWRKNAEKKLSQLEYRITFSKEEREKNQLVDPLGNDKV